MKALVLPMMLVAAALAAPVQAVAGEALNQARAVSNPSTNFDGGRARAEGDLVRAGAPTDRRTAGQIANDEQIKADTRSIAANLTVGADKEIEPPKPNEWLKTDHLLSGVQGALIGLLVGSLWGVLGLAVGALIGGLLGYGVSRFAANAE